MRVVLAILIAIHAVAHLPGFMSGLGFSRMTLSRPVTQGGSMAWGLACVLFLSATGMLLAGKQWGLPGLLGVVISQVLIVLWWRDAKLGTIVNLIVFLPAILNIAEWQFGVMANRQATVVLSKPRVAEIDPTRLAGLPLPVRRWLETSGALQAKQLHTLRLRQKGKMRMEPAGKWLAVTAEQYFNADSPSFVWVASINGGTYSIAGKDVFENGKGRMTIKVASLFTVADATGPEMDQGTMLRYLAEIQWFPQAALSAFIRWEQIDPLTARAIFTVGGKSVEGIFYFNEQGDVTLFEAQRYMEHKGKYSLQTWSVPVTAYAQYEGVRVPCRGNAIWKLKEGDFNWFRWEVTEINYNPKDIY